MATASKNGKNHTNKRRTGTIDEKRDLQQEGEGTSGISNQGFTAISDLAEKVISGRSQAGSAVGRSRPRKGSFVPTGCLLAIGI